METNREKSPIVVGIDEGPESVVALRWAAQEAATTYSPLVLVHAFEWLPQTRLGRDDYYFPLRDEGLDKTAREQYEQNAKEMLADATAIVNESGSGLEVETKVVEGVPFETLEVEARNASLLVLGSHSRGLLGRMLLGSVSSAIASDPPCPVAVVRTHTRAVPVEATDMPVVAGFDGTPASRTALAFAADHAARHGSQLIVVHAFHPVDQRTAGSVSEQAGRRTAWLRENVQMIEKDHPGLHVTCTVTEHRPAQALVEWSVAARLIVVGTGGRRAYTGSVSQALLHHSWSPVVVIPEA
ncbi:universal stress protein [Phytomonospora sp. NPDC050363]|uniref:universal stress protein n=1 Tax=Phytomonospora sp. NPDC050363 TaxID=3155642 RepID=UPI0033EEEC9A